MGKLKVSDIIEVMMGGYLVFSLAQSAYDWFRDVRYGLSCSGVLSNCTPTMITSAGAIPAQTYSDVVRAVASAFGLMVLGLIPALIMGVSAYLGTRIVEACIPPSRSDLA